MKLPYADEIARHRAAQRLVLPKATGCRNVQRAKVELEQVQTLVAKGVRNPSLPGAEEVQAAASLHPDLVDLESMCPTDGDLHERLIARGAQLDLAMRTLWPFMNDSSAIDEALKVLWHKQAEAIHGHEHVETKQRVAAWMARRTYLAEQIPALDRWRSAVSEILTAVEHQVPSLETALVTTSRSDDPRLAVRASVLAFDHRRRALEIADQRNLVLAPVPEPAVPDTPHARHNLRLRRETAAVLEWMRTMATTCPEHLAILEDRLRDITEEMTLVQAEIEALTG